MSPGLSNRLLVLLAALVSLVGAVDAGLGREWDLLATFAIGLALQSILIWRLQSRRPAVPLRGDLVAWLRERSALTGEPVEVIADRCLAASRAGLDG